MENKMIKFLLILILLPLLVSWGSISKEERLANQIIVSFGKQQERQKQLDPFGIGGSMPDTIRTLSTVYR